MYLQIADDLRNRIELGATLPTESGDAAAVGPDGQLPEALAPGSQLPTELDLSDGTTLLGTPSGMRSGN